MNIHLVQMSHTDVGYTDSPQRVGEAYAYFLDESLRLVSAYKHYPESCRFRWTVETAWALRQFVERRPERVSVLVDHVRNGYVELAANYVHFTDVINRDLLRESTEWLVQFLDRHQLKVRVAVHNDINGFPSALPSVLRDIGVECLVSGMNHTYALGLGERHRAGRWIPPDGVPLTVWHGDHYNLGNWLGLSARNTDQIFGRPTWPYEGPRDEAETLYPEAVGNTQALLQKLKVRHYPFNCLLIQCAGLQADNSPPDPVMCDVAHRINAEHSLGEDVHVRISTVSDFFTDLQSDLSRSPMLLEEWHGVWPDYWALGLGAAPSEIRSLRRTQDILPLAKELAGADHRDYREAVDKALLAAEHTFGSYDSVTEWFGPNAHQQWACKQEAFYRAEQLCEGMIETGLLRAYAAQPLADQEAILLNPHQLTGRSSGIIQIPRRLAGKDTDEPFLEMEGATEPLQALSQYDINFGRHCVGGHYLFRADTKGQTTLKARIITKPADRHQFDHAACLENDWICLKPDLEELGLCSLYDKMEGREYVHPEGTPIGALLHEVHPQMKRPPDATDKTNESEGRPPTISSFERESYVTRHRSRCDPASFSLRRGPLFDEMIIHGVLKSYQQVQLAIRLHHETGCIEFVYSGIKEWLNESNADHVLFMADIAQPKFLIEASCGNLFEPGREQVAGSCLDFYTVQHLCVLHNDHDGLFMDPVDAPLIQIGQPSLAAWRRHLNNPAPMLVSNFYNNLWFTNFPSVHVGVISARYILKVGAFKQLELHRRDLDDARRRPLIGHVGEKRRTLQA